MNKKLILFGFIFINILLINACQKETIPQQEPIEEGVPETVEEPTFTQSAIPPREDEIIQLSNGYSVTLRMKEIVDARCREWGPDFQGGDTGSGYGCIPVA